MKPFKTMLRYRTGSYRNSVLILLAVEYFLFFSFLLTSRRMANSMGDFSSSFNGIELMSLIVVFIVGLCSFREEFLFFSACGVSRKKQFAAAAASFGILSAIFALLDTINSLVFSLVSQAAGGGRFSFHSLLSMVYSGASSVQQDQEPLLLLVGFVWRALLLFAVSMVGYFITILYFRMNKFLKIVVSIGVPVLFIYVLPAIDGWLTGGLLLEKLTYFLFFQAFGVFETGVCYPIAYVSFLVAAAVFAALALALARRAPVRE